MKKRIFLSYSTEDKAKMRSLDKRNYGTLGENSDTTSWDVPSDDFKIYNLDFLATDSGALRIHLHCKAGSGKIIIENVVVSRY